MTLQLFGIRTPGDETVLNVQIPHDPTGICYLDMFHLYVSDMVGDIDLSDPWSGTGFL